MTGNLTERLNQILPRITTPEFLAGEGIGNEIACYVFDYPAVEELRVREHLELIENRLESHHAGIRFVHIDLLKVVVEYLSDRGLLEKALTMQVERGSAALLKALSGPLSAEKVRDFIANKYDLKLLDLILMSGIGSVWPMLRAHNLLNCLHTAIGEKPLVMFYPGSFDGTTLHLFGQATMSADKPTGNPYYRAFILVPGGTAA